MTTTTDTPATAAAHAADDPLSTVQSLYAAFGRGDVTGMLEQIHPQVDWSVEIDAPGAELVPMLHNGTGHDAVLRYFGGVGELEFHTFAPTAFHVIGDVVLVELDLDLSHRATGKRMRMDEIHRFVIREGQIVHYRPFCDTAGLIEVFRV